MNAQQIWNAAEADAKRLMVLRPLVAEIVENPVRAAMCIIELRETIKELQK